MKRKYSLLLLTLVSLLLLGISQSSKIINDSKKHLDIYQNINSNIINNNNITKELSNRLFIKQNYQAISIKEQNSNDSDKKLIAEEENNALIKSINSNYNNMKLKNYLTFSK